MYRIIIVILVCVSLLGCASLQAKSAAAKQEGPKADQQLKTDVLTCQKGLSATWRASTQFISNNDTLIILCEYTKVYGDDRIWSCIWDPKNNNYDCRYKQSRIQILKEHIPSNPSDRYDLFCGPCAGGWK
jgi:hypothetical protein